jgi:2-oxoglutarate ferredoxin oxidoreductase subunit gamma
VVGRPNALLIMNGPSMEKFLPMLATGGDLIINSSLVEERLVTRNDVRLLSIPADDIARSNKIGSRQMASMVALGAYVARSGIVRLSTVFDCLPKVVSKKYEKFIPLNVNALKEGAALAGIHA